MREPYKTGDAVRALFDGRYGPTLGTLYVKRVRELSDGRWRITCDRDHPTCPEVAFVVDSSGKDQHGYCWPSASVSVTV